MGNREFMTTVLVLLLLQSCTAHIYSSVMTSLPRLVNRSLHHRQDDTVESAQLLRELDSRLDFQQMMTVHSYLMLQNPGSTCDKHLNDTLEMLFNKTDWALQMTDAMGKPGAGFMQGNLFWLGSYDECVNITATVPRPSGTTDTFKGKYCRAGFPIAPQMAIGIRFGPNEIPVGDLNFGICVPDSCTANDVKNLINGVLKNFTLKANAVLCQDENLALDTRAITVIVLFSILGFIIVAATAYDILVIHKLPVKGDPDLYTEETKPLVSGSSPDTDSQSRNIRYRAYGTRETADNQVDRTNIQEPRQTGIGVCIRLLLAFSLYTNGAKLLSTSTSEGTISALHGVRFISLTWVMLGHTYAFSAATAANVGSFLSTEVKNFAFMAIWNATVAVDTFFLLSGLLVAYLTLREMARVVSVRKINWVMFYIHRFWRLTPPYMLVIMLYVPLFQYWYNGPFWAQQGTEANHCESWWKNILYINNFFPNQDTCMVWSWYLANDMQFYIISPLLVIPLYISGILGGVLCTLVLLASWIATGVITSSNNYPMGLIGAGSDFSKIGDYFNYLYIRPYARIGPYIIGLLTGYLLHKSSCKVNLPRWLNLLGWLVAAGCCLSVVYGNYDYVSGKHMSGPHVAALYNAVHSTVWALGVSWVIFACATGYGGPVQVFLSWRLFIPLSRLTYLAYLVHPVVMQVFYLGLRQALYITHPYMAFLFLAHVVMSYAVAFVLSLAFESPFMGIEKALLGKQK